MLRKSNINRNGRVALTALGLLASVGIGVLSSDQTYAAECTVGSPYSCVSVTFGNLSGETTASPGKEAKSRIYFTMPVSVTMSQVKNYSINVYDSNGGTLNAAGGTIPSVTGATSWKQLSEMNRAWGFRYTAGKADDGTKDFQPIPTQSNQAVVANNVAVNARGGAVADYTLGFGVVVDGNTAAGDYTDTLTVAVVAQPRDITIHDIKYMQDMTTDICKATTTPVVMTSGKTYGGVAATLTSGPTDTTGDHHGDPNYVPETTLIDKRGGGADGSGKYLIRKLADGNCWMSQNLELNILGTNTNATTVHNYKTSNAASGDTDLAVTATNYFGDAVTDGLVFTANDTDLNSTSVWTPDYFLKTYAQAEGSTAPYAKVYATMSSTVTSTDATYGWANNGRDGMRSYSFAASNSAWNYSSLPNASSKDANGNYTFTDASSGVPSARRGNLYNWTAATLGSSLKLTTDGEQAEDSICPRGWQLPTNGVSSDLTAALDTVTDKSFTKLLRTYEMTSPNGASLPNFNRLNEWPLQFLRTGYYDRSYGDLARRTTHGHWWSDTAGSATYGRGLNTGTGYVYAQSNYWRGYGFALRCVAR